MAARVLRHYKGSSAAAATWTPINAAVPANRALVISKLLIVNLPQAAFKFAVRVAPGNDSIAYFTDLGPGEIYAESGLVLLAGEFLEAYCTTGPNHCSVTIFGEEVDN